MSYRHAMWTRESKAETKAKNERSHMLLLDCACACSEEEGSQEQTDEVDEGVE